MIEFEKFPDIVHQGRRLIWDSRQAPDGRPEWVFVPSSHVDPKVQTELLSRANAVFVVSAEGISPEANALLKQVKGSKLEVPDPRRYLGEMAGEAEGNPSESLCVVAVTGTNGKTTSAQLLRRAFVAAGHVTAEIGTLGISLWHPGEDKAREALETGFTTPEAPTLHRLFRRLRDRGVTHIVMEASSHAMELGRIAGIDLDGALFTNLSRDHLDFHGTIEAYEKSKEKLFTEYLPRAGSPKRKIAVLNARDAAGLRILQRLPLGLTAEAFAEGRGFRVLRDSLEGLRIELDDGMRVETQLVGAFNAENLAGALMLARGVLAATESDWDWPTVAHDTASDYSGPPGRMERVPSQDGRHVFVDYAHTPDALEKTLAVFKAAKGTDAKLSVVFGCGGDRDRTKRPEMGRIAAALADFVYVTSDNPRTEAPEAILAEIQVGIPTDRTDVFVDVDRTRSIAQALGAMKAGDVCLVAGKGHEPYQIIGTVKKPFSDVETCARLLASPRH